MQGSSDVNLKCISPLQELDSDIIDLILMFADINICLKSWRKKSKHTRLMTCNAVSNRIIVQ